MSKSRIIMSVASITLLAAAINASAANQGEGFKNERSAEANASFQQFLQRGRQQAPTVLSQVPTKGAAECAAAATVCVFSLGGFGLGCGAAVTASWGALSPACLAVWTAVGGTCATAAFYCAGGTGTPPVRRLSTAGDFTDDGAGPDFFVERLCPNEESFVDQVRVGWIFSAARGRISNLQLRCTPATSGAASTFLTFGHAYTSSNTYTCSAGRLQAGFLVSAGLELDAMGGVCRQVSKTNLTTYVNGIWGGTGGSRQDKVCPGGQNLVGAKINMDGANEAEANLLGVEPICR